MWNLSQDDGSPLPVEQLLPPHHLHHHGCEPLHLCLEWLIVCPECDAIDEMHPHRETPAAGSMV